MNKTVQSIVSLTTFSALLIAITLFCGGLGIGRLFGISGIIEYCLLGYACNHRYSGNLQGLISAATFGPQYLLQTYGRPR